MSVAALAALAEDPIFGPAQYALPAASTESASVSCTSSCLSALTVRSGLEPVGAAYHALVFPESGDSVDLDAVEAAEAAAQEDYKIYRRVMRASLYDYYALLNLSEKNIEATEAEIRASYRKLSLLCHPDKATPEDREDAEARFKSMQKGTSSFFPHTFLHHIFSFVKKKTKIMMISHYLGHHCSRFERRQ